MISKEILLEIAKKKGLINKEHIEKNYFQDLFLFNLYKKTNLLVFKGGTALYKFYSLPRFSEDLDFTALKNIDFQDIINKIVKEIDGAEIKEIKKIKDSLLFKIGLKGIITRYNTIRIDINLKNTLVKNFEVKNYISSFIDINPFSVRILTLEEILAEKIHALLSREKARDLYDLFFLLRLTSLDKSTIDKKLKIFNMSFHFEELKKRIINLEKVWNKELKSFVIGELPDFKTVKDFAFEQFQKPF